MHSLRGRIGDGDVPQQRWMLQVITVVMPEHLAALRSLKKKEELVSSLELLDNPDVTATSIEVRTMLMTEPQLLPHTCVRTWI